jgi:hypothetical protein
MWSVIPSLVPIVQGLSVVFTQPSFATYQQVLLGWIMCLGRRTEFRVFEAIGGVPVARGSDHSFHRFYNFFGRSAWTVSDAVRQVAVQVVMKLCPGGELHLVVDATLLRKSGKHVYAIGWFHDAVRSTKKRVATALGNQWVVLGLTVRIPGTKRVFCLLLHAMLQQPGKGKTAAPELARRMLADVLEWFPERRFVMIGDGGFSANKLLGDLDPRVRYVGLMRADAALREMRIPPRPKSKRGPKPKQGPRLPSPCEAARRADGARGRRGRWQWRKITVLAYGAKRRVEVCPYDALWPKVFGSRPIQVVLCRTWEIGDEEVYLYTTDLDASPAWVVENYARRTSIEAAFKESKQVMEIQKPQHWCRASIEKLAPWVWLTQSVVALWYFTAGRDLPEAREARRKLGPWETEWSIRFMLRLLRRVSIQTTINTMSAKPRDLRQLVVALVLQHHFFGTVFRCFASQRLRCDFLA